MVFLEKTQKAIHSKGNIGESDFIKIINICSCKDPVKEIKFNPQTGRKDHSTFI